MGKKNCINPLYLILMLCISGCSLVPESLADAISGATKGMTTEGNS